MTGTACAAAFCVTTTPKRDAICAMKRTRTGAPSPTTPRSAMKRGLRERFGKQPADGEIPALRRIRFAIARPQGENLQAGEGAFRARQILALAACNVSDRPQHYDGRDREFYRQRGE